MKSSLHDWFNQGIDFFAKQLYRQAALCFTKAHQPWWCQAAEAYDERIRLRQMPSKNTSRSSLFNGLARRFEELTSEAPTEDDAILLSENAAYCFVEGGNWSSAARSFYRCRQFNESVVYYRKAGLFDDAIRVINRQGTTVDSNLKDRVEYAATLHYTKTSQFKWASIFTSLDFFLLFSSKALQLCQDEEEYHDFLQDHSFESQQVKFLQHQVSAPQEPSRPVPSLTSQEIEAAALQAAEKQAASIRAAHKELARIAHDQTRYTDSVMSYLAAGLRTEAVSVWKEGFWTKMALESNFAERWKDLAPLLALRSQVDLTTEEAEEVRMIACVRPLHRDLSRVFRCPLSN